MRLNPTPIRFLSVTGLMAPLVFSGCDGGQPRAELSAESIWRPTVESVSVPKVVSPATDFNPNWNKVVVKVRVSAPTASAPPEQPEGDRRFHFSARSGSEFTTFIGCAASITPESAHFRQGRIMVLDQQEASSEGSTEARRLSLDVTCDRSKISVGKGTDQTFYLLVVFKSKPSSVILSFM